MNNTINDTQNRINSLHSLYSNYNSYNAKNITDENKVKTKNEGSLYTESTKSYVSMVKQSSADLKVAVDSVFNKFPPAFKKAIAASSDALAMTVKTDQTRAYATGATPGAETKVDIKQVAAAQENSGNGLKADAASNVQSGRNAFQIQAKGKTIDLSIDVNDKDTNQSVQQKLADAINKKGIGVTASLSFDKATNQSSLILKSSETGEKNAFTIQDTTGDAVAKLGIGAASKTATDAKFTINGGLERTSSSNEVELGRGVTATLHKATDKTVTSVIKHDSESMVNTVKDIAEKYNKLLKNSKESNSFAGKTVENQLSGAFTAHASSLGAVGITTAKDGSLSVDTEKLQKAAENGTLESAIGGNSRTSGFLNKVQNAAKTADSNPYNFVEKSNYTRDTSKYSSPSYNYNLSRFATMGSLMDTMF